MLQMGNLALNKFFLPTTVYVCIHFAFTFVNTYLEKSTK